MIDLKITNDGELVVENGDFVLVKGDEALAQQALFRMKTTKGDWLLSPNVGCSLEDFIGAPNEQVTWLAIETRVAIELTKDLDLPQPTISCVPLTDNEVFILVEFPSIEEEKRTIQIQAQLDLRKGLVFARSLIVAE